MPIEEMDGVTKINDFCSYSLLYLFWSTDRCYVSEIEFKSHGLTGGVECGNKFSLG